MNRIARHGLSWMGFVLMLTCVPAATLAAPWQDEPSLFELSLDELLDLRVRVPGALTDMPAPETPAAITYIDAEAIRRSTARNLYDLIEQHVPGAIWLNHEDGPHPGIRGSILNRNFKFLFLVNGRVLGNKGAYGAKSELELWDLGDIQRVEVVRGPGSVTYGAGAVAGVIHIITHDARSLPGSGARLSYVESYDSAGASAHHSWERDDWSVLAYGGVTRTLGMRPNHFHVNGNNEAGFIGDEIETSRQPLDYFADFRGNPQLKFHLDARRGEHWRFWSRYTQQGSTWRGNEAKTNFSGQFLNQQSLRDRQFTLTSEYEHELGNGVGHSLLMSFDSYDTERIAENLRDPDPDHPLNKRVDFAEHEILLRSLLRWETNESTRFALGAEYALDRFGAGWGDSAEDMRLGERGIIVSGPDSRAIRPGNGGSADDDGNAIFVGDGWTSHTGSLFAEINLEPWTEQHLLLSGRIDRASYSDWAVSPRLAFISRLRNRHYLKLIVQQSERMNTAAQLYAENESGVDPTSETLSSAELRYSAFLRQNLALHTSAFRNNVDVLGWDGDGNRTLPVGELELYGLEAEFEYRWRQGKLAANYAFTKQLDWSLHPTLGSSGISYSDYREPIGDGTQIGVGNDLNNWPNQSLKLLTSWSPESRLDFRLNAVWLWDYQGSLDGLEGLLQAVAGTADEAAVRAAVTEVRARDAYESQLGINASAAVRISEQLQLQLFAYNLLGENGLKRYSYDTGNDDPAPRRVRYIEEPRAFGARLVFSY